jgi:hypothetical protein
MIDLRFALFAPLLTFLAACGSAEEKSTPIPDTGGSDASEVDSASDAGDTERDADDTAKPDAARDTTPLPPDTTPPDTGPGLSGPASFGTGGTTNWATPFATDKDDVLHAVAAFASGDSIVVGATAMNLTSTGDYGGWGTAGFFSEYGSEGDLLVA